MARALVPRKNKKIFFCEALSDYQEAFFIVC